MEYPVKACVYRPGAKLIMKKLRLLMTTLVALPALAGAQNYPNKPVRMVVGFAAGGAPDILARLIAQPFNERLRQPLVVDNRPGAASTIGADIVAHAPKDGYTLLMATVSLAISPSVYPQLTLRVPEDFAAVSMVASVPLILVVFPGLPAKTMPDLIRLMKERPGQYNYASVGGGSLQHLAAELFKLKTGTQMTHVPYKGGAPANTALLAGEAQVYFSGMPPALPLVQAGRLRALAVTSTARVAAVPDVPTMAEAGLPGSEADNWHAVIAPRDVPADVVKRLNETLMSILADSALQKQFAAQGAQARSSTPQALQLFVRQEVEKWRGVARAANIQLQ